MLNRRFHPHEWQQFFHELTEELSQDSTQRYVMIRVSAPELTSTRDVAAWLEFEQISYDPETNTLQVLLDGFDHIIEDPDMIWAAIKAKGSVERVIVIRRDGSRDYIEFSKYRFPHSALAYGSRPVGASFLRNAERRGTGTTGSFWGRVQSRIAG